MTALPDWYGPLPRDLWTAIDAAPPGYFRRCEDLQVYALMMAITALADGDDGRSDVWLLRALAVGTAMRWAARRAS